MIRKCQVKYHEIFPTTENFILINKASFRYRGSSCKIHLKNAKQKQSHDPMHHSSRLKPPEHGGKKDQKILKLPFAFIFPYGN